ncbi:hypothetical protein CTAM01_15263 [Colletotrichum tamarilloi]|uniref:Uncharacterized protein n=1 Tax=Colletotrichum tamarilloi TaxID=1209934 RepID=A0ABQ9QLU3_9PEZI|nr:uncharacterized protein CTAM01_15263 [Colletotrichum tamarilloi]KAK1476993.1 hypothetical protein CTAM01_15263 [Colletotrichum tamarilloi]
MFPSLSRADCRGLHWSGRIIPFTESPKWATGFPGRSGPVLASWSRGSPAADPVVSQKKRKSSVQVLLLTFPYCEFDPSFGK